jgi:hypothetical protein
MVFGFDDCLQKYGFDLGGTFSVNYNYLFFLEGLRHSGGGLWYAKGVSE